MGSPKAMARRLRVARASRLARRRDPIAARLLSLNRRVPNTGRSATDRPVEYLRMAVEEQTPLRLVGKRFKRADSPERLTGQVRYTGDLVLPGLLHGRLVRSPHASARIVSIDKSAAEATPGVVAVLTAEDLPVSDIRGAVESRTIMMALERTTYVGQPVAVVLAESEAAAQDGAQSVDVDYEPQASTLDMLHALSPDSP